LLARTLVGRFKGTRCAGRREGGRKGGKGRGRGGERIFLLFVRMKGEVVLEWGVSKIKGRVGKGKRDQGKEREEL